MWLRLASEPATVNTAKTSFSTCGQKARISSSVSCGRFDALGFGRLDRVADGLVRVAEGQALLDQVVGEVGGGGEALGQRSLHVVGADGDAAGHVGEDAQGVGDGVDGVEQRFLVFLVVLVVSQRLRLHQGQAG